MRGQPIRRLTAIWIKLLFMVFLVGCAGKETILPQEGPTMKEVYESHFDAGYPGPEGLFSPAGDPGAKSLNRPAGTGKRNLAGYTRDADHEIRSVFPILPNPVLVMYVYPHLAGPGYPVPGYATSFPMYNRIEYALPGEVEGW